VERFQILVVGYLIGASITMVDGLPEGRECVLALALKRRQASKIVDNQGRDVMVLAEHPAREPERLTKSTLRLLITALWQVRPAQAVHRDDSVRMFRAAYTPLDFQLLAI
jgi:hypothetical protein